MLAVQAVRRASIVAVSTRSDTARASSLSDVMKSSACSCVSATNSASYVVSQPNWSATVHALRRPDADTYQLAVRRDRQAHRRAVELLDPAGFLGRQ